MSAAIPLIEAGSGGALALYEKARERTAALLATALAAHPLLAPAARPGDLVSRAWLARQASPYLAEIDAVARGVGRPGAYLLNAIYEWACSTSVGPDPAGAGNRMIRILDWGLPGIGRYVVVGRHEGPAGAWFNATWPGYAGVLTAMAPGRFSVALNQAPRRAATGSRWPDEVAGRLRMLRGRGGIPAAHLLRRVCETARDFAGAVAMLADERVRLAVPAIFTVSGLDRAEAAIVEALEERRRLRRAGEDDGAVLAAANAWQEADWPGDGRRYVGRCCPALDPAEDNRRRRDGVLALQRGAFAGHADLRAPVLNGHSVLVAVMNARRGTLRVEALDRAGGPLPGVVAGPLDIAA